MTNMKKMLRSLSVILALSIVLTGCMTAFAAGGKWIKSGSRWWYQHADSSYTSNDWEKINNKWYHFDKKGWMQTGWLKVKNDWYFLNNDGSMRTGAFNYKGKEYYCNQSGKMKTGWLKMNYNWYYYNSNGAKRKGWLKYKNQWYYLSEYDGEMMSNIIWEIDNPKEKNPLYATNRYYFDKGGVMQTGWARIDLGDGKDWGYFNSNGEMQFNKWVDGKFINVYGRRSDYEALHLEGNVQKIKIESIYSEDGAETEDSEKINAVMEELGKEILSDYYLAPSLREKETVYVITLYYENEETKTLALSSFNGGELYAENDSVYKVDYDYIINALF